MERKRRRKQRGKQHPDHDQLFSLASQQAGYFTAEQATDSGFSRPLLFHHARQGTFMRVRRGLYRLARFPGSQHEEIVAAWLALDPEKAAVFSRERPVDL